MPRYFFDVITDGQVVSDHHGDDLANKQEARDMVVALLVDMAEREIGDGDRAEVTISARGENGRPVYQASLAFTGLWGR